MSESLFERLGNELRALIVPVVRAAEDPAGLENLFVELGVGTDNPGTSAITAAVAEAAELAAAIEDLAESPAPSFAEITKLLTSARQMVSALRSLDGASGPAAALAELGEELVQLLVGLHLARRHPLAYRLGILLTVIESFEEATPTAFEMDGEKVLRTPVTIPRFRPERLVGLVRDPAALLRSAYLNDLATADDAHAMADRLFVRVGRALTELGVPWRYGVREPERALLGDAAAFVDHSLSVYAEEQFSGATVDAGVRHFPSRPPHTETWGSLGIAVGYPNILWSVNHYYPQEHPHDYPH